MPAITYQREVERYQCIRTMGADGHAVGTDWTVKRWMTEVTMADGVTVGGPRWLALKDRPSSSFASADDFWVINDDDVINAGDA